MSDFEEVWRRLEERRKEPAWKIRRAIRTAFEFPQVFWAHRIRGPIRRARRGYSSEDLWNFDVYISGVVARALTEIRDSSHGYYGDSPEEWRAFVTSVVEPLERYASAAYLLGGEGYEEAEAAMKKFGENLGRWWD